MTFRADIPRSPNSRRAEAHHLKLFRDFLREQGYAWTDVDLQRLGAFMRWLRRPRRQRGSRDEGPLDGIHNQRHGDDVSQPGHTDATIDQILTAVHSFYDFHMRLHTLPDLALYRF